MVPPTGGVSVTEKVPSAAVVTGASVAVVSSGRVRVTASRWAPGAAPSARVSRPVIVSGSSALADAGGVSSMAEVGSVAPATRHRKKVPACQLFSTPKTSAPRKTTEWRTRSPAAPPARDSIVPSATLWTVSSTPP
jgi:hypothetical protein